MDNLAKLTPTTVFSPEAEAQYHHFHELLIQILGLPRGRNNAQTLIEMALDLSRYFMDNYPAISHRVTTKDLQEYSWAVYSASTYTRFARLANDKNRDNDKKDTNHFLHEFFKSAVIHFNNLIMTQEISPSKMSGWVLQNHIYSLIGYFLKDEILQMWELGINSMETVEDSQSRLQKTYFSEKVLAAVLPAAFEANRFTYEECLQIFEANTANKQTINENLRASIAKIAIRAQDYTKALDMLDSLTDQFLRKQAPSKSFRALSEVHLAFIGDCKDIAISKHFFDKVINFELKYDLVLKVRQIESLLENCQEKNEPMENIAYFWISAINFYEADRKFNVNSRFSVLNNAFFKIFFERNPTLDPNSLALLKKMIQDYAQVKAIDETFLNTVITNCPWNNREIFDQLLDCYRIYNVERTEVSYRIALKKIGELGDFSLQEIVAMWNEGLRDLDSRKIQYIPIANWAALRDATVLSPHYAEERRALYYELVKIYKNYMQDKSACQRFLKKWRVRPLELEEMVLISQQDDPKFLDDATISSLDLTIPEFKHLKENCDYRAATSGLAGSLMSQELNWDAQPRA